MVEGRLKTYRISLAFSVVLMATLACSSLAAPQPTVTPATTMMPVEPSSATLYGFFPSPPQMTYESVVAHFANMGRHGDVVLVQNSPDWRDFLAGVEGVSDRRTDITNQVTLARQNGLDAIFVADPLNGLNRREFGGLPSDWTASFANPDVRTAFTNYVLWILRTFKPRYLGLGSEINTYADAYPDDFPNYVSLYHELYAQIKAESPETQVFVTFQWEDLNNLIANGNEGRAAHDTNWDQVEIFEPNLDLWVISSYPFVAFPDGRQIPSDYYTPLLTRTTKPLAVAEGGIPSVTQGPISGSEEGQVDYLKAIDDQIGSRLSFWIYLLLSDLDPTSWNPGMAQNGTSQEDINTLGWFVSVGLTGADGAAKSGMTVWDTIRAADAP